MCVNQYYIHSSDPSDYGTVHFNITPIVSQAIQCRITGIGYTANFSITTNDDYIEVEYSSSAGIQAGLEYSDDTTTKLYFNDCGFYDINVLKYTLNDLFDSAITFNLLDTGLLTIQSDTYKRIISCSHRVSLLLGLYHETLPVYINTTYTSPSIPLTCFGNLIYIVSNIPSIVGMNEKEKERYKNISYKGSDFLYPGIPVNSKTPGPLTITRSDGLTDLKFQLVDFQLEPIILHSPLFISFEVYFNIVPQPMLQAK